MQNFSHFQMDIYIFSILNFAIIKEIPTAIQFATYKQVFSKIPYNRWLGRFSCLSYRDKANHLINVSQSKRKSGKKTSHAAMEEAKAIFQEIINLNAFRIITKQALKNAIHFKFFNIQVVTKTLEGRKRELTNYSQCTLHSYTANVLSAESTDECL